MPEEKKQSKNALKAIIDRVEECIVQAEAHLGIKVPRGSVKFDLTGTKGGTSHFAKRLFRFNRKLLTDNFNDYIETVVPHEVAHHVCRSIHGYPGIKSHGNEWKKIMIEVYHLPPKVTHSFDVSKVRRKTQEYRYTCACTGRFHFVGLNKHNKIRRGNVSCCTKCNSKITFDGKGHSHAPTKLIETPL